MHLLPSAGHWPVAELFVQAKETGIELKRKRAQPAAMANDETRSTQEAV